MKAFVKKLSAILLIAILCCSFSVPVTALEFDDAALYGYVRLPSQSFESYDSSTGDIALIADMGFLYDNVNKEFIYISSAYHEDVYMYDDAIELDSAMDVTHRYESTDSYYGSDSISMLGEMATVTLTGGISENSRHIGLYITAELDNPYVDVIEEAVSFTVGADFDY